MLKDSGGRREFESGALRDMEEGKGRYDLLQMYALNEMAKLMEQGAKKYGENNWKKGIPNASFIDSAFRHLNKFVRGDCDEPHLVQAAWNLLCAIDQQERVKLGLLDPRFDNIGAMVVAPEMVVPEHIELHSDSAPAIRKSYLGCEYFREVACTTDPCPDCELAVNYESN